ncbi:MAG: alpha/beta hydrolase [Burkholderiaceae bacterium]
MTTIHQTVAIGPLVLPGDLALPGAAAGLVVFVHGSGSSHRSARNRAVSQALQQRRIATLLFDLLTPQEAEQGHKVFDIDLLALRLLQAMDWLRGVAAVQGLPLGLFGASTGAAAALVASAQRPRDVTALVSRGGRPDLAGPALGDVRCPTLLIVGAADVEVLQLNMAAYARLKCEKHLEIVPRASHLFAEAGAMESVVRLARDWFANHFAAPSARDG